MNNWIKIENKLPENLSKVDILINAQIRLTDAEFYDGKFYIFPPYAKECWTEVKNNITRWMYLPSPPEGEINYE